MQSINFWGATALLATSFTYAQAQVSTTTQSSALSEIQENAFANISVRHYTDVAMQKDDVSSVTPKVQLRPTIGTSLLRKKLDLSLTGYFDKKTDTTEVSQAAPRLIAGVNAYANNNFILNPYLDNFLPHAGAGALIAPGLTSIAQTKVSSKAGSFTLKAISDAWVIFSDRQEEATYDNQSGQDNKTFAASQEGFSLAAPDANGKQDLTGKKKDPSMQHDWYAQVTYQPSAKVLRKISVTGRQRFANTYEPQYAVDAAGKESMTYKLSQQTENLLSLKYTWDKKVSFNNDFYAYADGYLAKRTAGRRYLNVAYVTYNL